MIGRLIGWIFFLAGLAVLARDAFVWIETKQWAPIALGQLWYDLNRSSLNLVQAVVQRYLHPFLWDPIIVTVLLWWAFAVLMVLGLLILALSGRRARTRAPLTPAHLEGGDEGGLRDFDLAELAHLNNATRWFGHESSLAGREITGKFS